MAKLLVVDDDKDGRDVLFKFLAADGHDVKCVSNGREALTAILAATPDLVILDMLMPEMNGATLLEILRSYLRLQALPVIVLTGVPDSPLVQNARLMNVRAILAKAQATPFDVVAAVNQEVQRAPKDRAPGERAHQ